MKHPLQHAEFVISSAGDDQLPPADCPEIAVAGRSNAGKSSAINALANRSNLAFTSKTPGRTQQINFFRLRSGALLADLPGVSEIEPRITFLATADLPDVVEPINSYVISLPDRRDSNLNDVVMRQGSYFTDRRDNEVIVNASFAREHRLEPGDYVHLLLNNRRQELFVVGTAISSEFAYLLGPGALIPDPEHFGVFYIKQTYAELEREAQAAQRNNPK